MISYEPFFKTINKKKITIYYLINQCGFSSSLFDKLRHGKNITTATINGLCKCLDCKVEDIIEYIEEN